MRNQLDLDTRVPREALDELLSLLGAGPRMVEVVEALDRHVDAELFMIGEQDLYPCDPDVPLPIARRTYQYLRDLGVGSDAR